MEVTVTEARRTLPELVRQVKADGDLRIRITVHGDVAAELRACVPDPPPGLAAQRLLDLMEAMPEGCGETRDISSNYKEHLYGKAVR